MDDTSLSKEKPMSLKNLDDPASKAFWEFVEKSTQEWRAQQPAWSREIEAERREKPERPAAPAQNIQRRVACG